MQNYHTHKCFSNINASFKDSAMRYADYAKRAVELNQQVITCVDHGTQGNFLRCWQTAQAHNLQFVYGVEAYWVRDWETADGAHDGTNAHIILLAQDMQGIREINKALSTANRDGYYRVPRLNLNQLLTISPEHVLVTTACVSFWAKIQRDTQELHWHYSPEGENSTAAIDEILEKIHAHFGSSLYLEVQCHHTPWQQQINQHILDLHYRHKIPLIAGLDSHYIYPGQAQERRWLREENDGRFGNESIKSELNTGVFEDYPDENTVVDRFRQQGVLNEAEIHEAISNTDVLLMFEPIRFDTERKIPSIYPTLTQEEKNNLYLQKVWDAWNENKADILKNARYLHDQYIKLYHMAPEDLTEPTEEAYVQAICEETNIVTSTGVADYFLLNAEMVKLGVQKGGVITPSGRGSASSFFTNTLLGLSTIDRISLPVKLYPERFVTKDRLMSSLPDIDMNVSDQQPFAEAQDELLTQACGSPGHAFPMTAYGTLKYKSAFKLYARTQNMPADEANAVSEQIGAFERALKEAEDDDERANLSIEDFVDSKYMKYIEASAPYRDIVVSKSQAPSAYMLYNGDIESEIGIMRINANGGKKVVYCTVVDGYTAEEFGYVKNDLLIVKVISVNAEAMRRAKIPPLTSQQLIRATLDDPATWDIFAKGYTQGINQCQGASTTEKLTQYKPRQLRDLAAFVAAIRPGFKSQLQHFLGRSTFHYDVPAFDRILKNDSTESAWMLYQENAMSALSLAGFPMTETYPIIKAISKKKNKVINSAKERFHSGFMRYLTEDQGIQESDAHTQTELVWNVIRDSAAYSFNASHAVCVSIDALYGAYLKAHYPYAYYTALLDSYAKSGNKDRVALIKSEMKRAFGIRIASPRFRQDNRGFFVDTERKEITDALVSIKHIGKRVPEILYGMRNREFGSFTDLLVEMDSHREITSRTVHILIMLNYFQEFGQRGKLLQVHEAFLNGENRFKKSYVESTQVKRLTALREQESKIQNMELPQEQILQFEAEYLGTPISIFPGLHRQYIALEVNDKYSPKVKLYSATTGETGDVKILKNRFKETPLAPGDILRIINYRRKPRVRYADGQRIPIPGVHDLWLYEYVITRSATTEKGVTS